MPIQLLGVLLIMARVQGNQQNVWPETEDCLPRVFLSLSLWCASLREHAGVGIYRALSAWTELPLSFSGVCFLTTTGQAEPGKAWQPRGLHLPQFLLILPQFRFRDILLGADSCWAISGVSMVHPAGNALPDMSLGKGSWRIWRSTVNLHLSLHFE